MANFDEAYFEQVHPVYPFLDQEAFERKVFGQVSSQSLVADKVWSALYHTILAIGCHYNDGGSFDPGNGQAWGLFEVALSYFQDVVMTKGSLMAVQVCHFPGHQSQTSTPADSPRQALTAMVRFPPNFSFKKID